MKKITLCLLLFSFVNNNIWSQNPCLETTTDYVVYDITFQSIWNATDHSSIPAGSHWSDLVVINHSTENQFLELGENATIGIQNVAELGDTTEISNDLATAFNLGTAEQATIVPFNAPNNATASVTLENSFCHNFPYLTILSMIAPSPDWFMAVNSVNLRDSNAQWIEHLELDVYVYDAGTDNGINYDSPDSPNSPVGISMINNFPINGNKIGVLTIDLVGVLLSNPNFEASNSFKITPNPSSGHVTINSNYITNLESVRVYNLLGSLVKTFKINSAKNTLDINLSSLNKGIYLLKLETKEGKTTTKKLIIE